VKTFYPGTPEEHTQDIDEHQDTRHLQPPGNVVCTRPHCTHLMNSNRPFSHSVVDHSIYRRYHYALVSDPYVRMTPECRVATPFIQLAPVAMLGHSGTDFVV
jgi:hypothetical protein